MHVAVPAVSKGPTSLSTREAELFLALKMQVVKQARTDEPSKSLFGVSEQVKSYCSAFRDSHVGPKIWWLLLDNTTRDSTSFSLQQALL